MRVVGVDGYRGGWVAVSHDTATDSLTPQLHPSFPDLLAAYPDVPAIAVDIPIGLAAGEPRHRDLAARRVLGFPRRTSVVPAPDPRLLDASTYQEALARSRALTGRGISKQTFAIFPKVAEVNRALTPALQEQVAVPPVCRARLPRAKAFRAKVPGTSDGGGAGAGGEARRDDRTEVGEDEQTPRGRRNQ